MATMWYKAVNCVVVYVDPAATGTATGVTPQDAITVLPTPSSMAGGTVYLLRRGLVSPAAYVLEKTTCAQDVVAIWGMPLSTDEKYAMVPAEAKAAWDADAATMPTLSTAAHSTTPPQFTGFGVSLHRLQLQWGFTAAWTAGVSLHFGGDAVSITQVKSMLAGLDISVQTTNTVITNSKLLSTIRFTGRHVRVADSEFQLPGTRDADGQCSPTDFVNTSALCYRNREGTFIVDNCVFRGAYGCQSYPASGLSCVFASARVAYIRNCSFDLVDYRSNNASQCARSAFKITAKIARIFNNTITARQFTDQGSATANTNYTYDPAVNIPAIGYALYPLAIVTQPSIDATDNPDDGTYATDVIVDTLSIDSAGMRTAPSGLIVLAGAASYNAQAPGCFQINVRNYTFAAAQAARINDTVCGLYVPTGYRVIVENTSVIYSNTMAFAMVSGSTPGNAPSYSGGKGTFRNCVASGRLRLDSINYAEFTALTIPAADVTSPLEVYGGITYIGTLTMPAGWVASSMMIAANRAQLFINSINIVAIVDLVGTATVSEQQTISIASNGAAGAWSAFHRWMTVKASTVYRTGGAGSALIFKTTTLSNSPRGVYLAPRPFAAKAIAPGATGLRRVVVYVAAKSLAADVVFRSVIVEVTTPVGASGSAIYSSASAGRLEVDPSVWVNDSGLSVYRIVVMVPVDRAENLGVRVAFRPFASTTAYIYVDPKIAVTA